MPALDHADSLWNILMGNYFGVMGTGSVHIHIQINRGASQHVNSWVTGYDRSMLWHVDVTCDVDVDVDVTCDVSVDA